MQVIEYLPIPFVPNGRTKDGIDCWGLICLIYDEKYGIKLPLYEGVNGKEGTEVAQGVAKEAALAWTEVPAEDRREGDVVVIRMMGLPWHVGMVLDKANFVHAYHRTGVTVERITAIHWKPRILAYYRFNEKM
jgi:cell wall-associated NlpC family hydrolase